MYRKRSPLFGNILELFRASAQKWPKAHKVIHSLVDQKDTKFDWTPLHWASAAGQPVNMNILINHGANPFILSNLRANILHAAAESKSVKGLEVGLGVWKRFPQQIDIDQRNNWLESPLHVASWSSPDCVKKLLEAGADPNLQQEDQQSPLHCAGLMQKGVNRRMVVDLLCSIPGELHIDAQDRDGRPPLFDFMDHPECVTILFNRGASLDILDSTGKSAFHHACILGEIETLEILLSLSPLGSGVIMSKDHAENTALIYALQHNNSDCARALLARDDVEDTVGQDGWSAIHHATRLGDAAVLEAVFQHSTLSKGLRTNDGQTAEVVAMEAGTWCGEVKALLRKHNSIA